MTLKDFEQLEEDQKRIEREKKISSEKRKKHSTKMVAEAIAHELQQEQGGTPMDNNDVTGIIQLSVHQLIALLMLSILMMRTKKKNTNHGR